ncbi:hypothetical protein [Methanoplanus endosymbiosus]|uniref:Uncharacterized protein n=1 Tax=Methanoplanus endosymbiosus TaxID=33865 RepID=A0A9E7PQV8_9EURY|nr:hypothetical protein [Methanoplanus endosymbiosus]UUX93156.1 hypothetical protein L6E24_03275 [Methanoplanus endosymbiosus]
MRKDLFRKEPLKRLAAPDNTQQLIVQPRLSLWILLAALAVILITVSSAYLTMTIYSTVNGNGIFISNSSDHAPKSPLDYEVLLFIPIDEGNKVSTGMKAQITPQNMDMEEYTYIKGTVTGISSWPVTEDEITERLNHSELGDYFLKKAGDPVYIVTVSPIQDKKDPESFVYSAQTGEEPVIKPYFMCHGRIITDEETVLEKFFPPL